MKYFVFDSQCQKEKKKLINFNREASAEKNENIQSIGNYMPI